MMQEPSRRGRGQPPFEPTPDQRKLVQIMRANGDALATIARNVGPAGIDVKTLRKHFADELATGHEQTRADVGAAVVKAALAGNMHAAKYWLSTHGGPEWRVVEGRQIGGLADSAPIAISAEARVVIYIPDNGRDRPSREPA